MIWYSSEKVDPVLEHAEREIRVLELLLAQANKRCTLTALGVGFFSFIAGIVVEVLIILPYIGGR